jgi:hypothetical protein
MPAEPITGETVDPLYVVDKEEWWDVLTTALRSLGRSITREEFDRDWDEFQDMKRRRSAN